MTRARLAAALFGAATVATAAAVWGVKWFAVCVNRVAGPDDEAAAAAEYAHMIGLDLPPEVRLEQARRLAVGAPVRHDGFYLEQP